VQRQLLSLLRTLGPDVLLATHSTEILAEADPSEIVLVDKTKRAAKRLRDVEGVQSVLDSVGSLQNITLTRLAKNRRVLFVEGEGDYSLLRMFARQLDLTDLASGADITAIVSEGFASWEKISSLGWGIQKVLGQSIQVAVVYDRDYWCAEDVAERLVKLDEWVALAHVHERKEIENYLLVPTALERALNASVRDKEKRTGERIELRETIREMLDRVTSLLKTAVQAQYVGKRVDYLRHSRRDSSQIVAETSSLFESRWNNLDSRLTIIPGKEVLRSLRSEIQGAYGITLTDQKIVSNMPPDEIASDLVELVRALDRFRQRVLSTEA
jgi:hypothetical protein